MQDRADPHARERALRIAAKVLRPRSLQTRLSPQIATCWIPSATPAPNVPEAS